MFKRVLLGVAVLALAGCVPPPQAVMVQERRCDTSFRVVNASSATVERLFFSHASQSGWGDDQLGEAVLSPGRASSYRAANTGAYDFRVVWANGRAAELRRVDICAASTITIQDGGLRAS